MAWKMESYRCLDEGCGNEFEFLTADPDERVECPTCEHSAKRVMSAPLLGLISNDPARRNEVLRKRSEADTKKQQKVGNLPTWDNYGEFKKDRKKKR